MARGKRRTAKRGKVPVYCEWYNWTPDPNDFANLKRSLNGMRFRGVPVGYHTRTYRWQEVMSRGRYAAAVARVKSIRAALNGHFVS